MFMVRISGGDIGVGDSCVGLVLGWVMVMCLGGML